MMANPNDLTFLPRVEPAGNRLGLVADFYNRHPGEQVCFRARLEAGPEQTMGTLSVALPKGLELIEYAPMDGERIRESFVRDLEDGLAVEWQIADEAAAGEPLVFLIRAEALPRDRDARLTIRAAFLDGQGLEQASECACIAIQTRSEYLKFLPEIYQGNDFLGRFLMVFESFWKPIDGQIARGETYYDIDLAPATFLPWLASWIGISWDENLPEERRRDLLHSALSLYQRRGTRQALEDFLRIYTGGEVEIVEHRAQNLVLSQDSKLGSTSALGQHNYPHTFTVNLRVPSSNLSQVHGQAQVNAEQFYRKNVEAIIATQKPAHTAFGLNLQVIDSGPSAQVH